MSVEGKNIFTGTEKASSGYFGMRLISIAHRIAHGTNVVVVNNQSANSKKFLLLFDWILITTTFIAWDILWAMLISPL